ncbi:MAG: plastocyanin/azurin family copper-binding protein [Gemmatimonadaceae bacterium]
MRSLILAIAAAAGIQTLPSFSDRAVTVELKTFQFSPDTTRVAVGTAVTWVNRDQVEHTVTGGTPQARTAAWNHVLRDAGRSATKRFDRAGTHTYFCDRHQFMRGTVIVSSTR